MRTKRLTRVLIAAAIATGLVAAASGCSPSGSANSSETTVKIGITPYFEYQPWVVAHELGLDKQQGINLEFTNYDNSAKASVAAYRGDIDLASNYLAGSYALLKQLPTLQDFMITNQFKGFILVGRTGSADSYATLSKEKGADAAKQQILTSLKGKTFDIVQPNYEALLSSALDQVGLSIKDIKINNFASDAQAAVAFEGGNGDYYIGGLPQEAKMLESPDKYVNVGGSDVLGPAALWFSSMAAKKSWLDDNKATTNKLLAIWYRTMRYMQEKPDEALPLFTDAVNKATSSSLSVKTVTSIVTDLERFATLPQAQKEFYSSSSDTYYKTSADFYAKENKSVLPADYDQSESISAPKHVDALIADQSLMKWLNKPLS